jgi:hypothetical protein
MLQLSRDSVDSIATRLRAGRFGDRISAGARDFFFSAKCPDGLCVLPSFCAMDTELKRQGREVNSSPPSGAEVMNYWSYTPLMFSCRGQGKLYIFTPKYARF